MVKKQECVRYYKKKVSTKKKKKELPKKKVSTKKKKKKKPSPKKKPIKNKPKKKKPKKRKKLTVLRKKVSAKKKKIVSPKKKKTSFVKNVSINYRINTSNNQKESIQSIICNIVTPNGDKVVLPSEFDARWTYDNLMDRKQRFSYYENLEHMEYLRSKYNEYRAICY